MVTFPSPGSSRPRPRNARAHCRKQIRQIAGSIQDFGFAIADLFDGSSVIPAGRAEAAKALSIEEAPTVPPATMGGACACHMSLLELMSMEARPHGITQNSAHKMVSISYETGV